MLHSKMLGSHTLYKINEQFSNYTNYNELINNQLQLKGCGQERLLDFLLKSNRANNSKLRLPICLYV